jgi:geranylgeranyl pyrophosphate synthase
LDLGISKELQLVEEQINRSLDCGISSVEEVAHYVMDAGGKRIRPAVLLLSFRALSGEDILEAIPMAAAFELIHTGTIIHDDINDSSAKRRGIQTAYRKFGTTNALVTGDYLFVRAFETGSRYQEGIRSVTIDACIQLVEGEIIQWENMKNIALSQEKYLKIIEKKTASPIAAGAKAGGIIAKGTESQVNALGNYGLNLGIGFQITDDIIDVVGVEEKTGKSIGKDISEGKLTILSIHALKHSTPSQRKIIEEVLLKNHNTEDEILEAIAIIKDANSIEYAQNLAQKYADIAKESMSDLPDSKWKDNLKSLADFSVKRHH